MTEGLILTTVKDMKDFKKRLVSEGVKYIAIEGNIGSGKTTLSRLIAEETGARLFLEQVNANPFVEKFYDDLAGYAFQAQIFFLLNRYRQQVKIAQQNLFTELLVADYLFEKDSIYAHVVLGNEELGLYNSLCSLLSGKIVCPDLVVYLQTDTEVLMERIRKRGRSFERNIDEEYLRNLNEAFNHFFFHYNDTPLLIVNTDQLDFTTNREHLNDFFTQISEKFDGTRYYVPSWENDF